MRTRIDGSVASWRGLSRRLQSQRKKRRRRMETAAANAYRWKRSILAGLESTPPKPKKEAEAEDGNGSSSRDGQTQARERQPASGASPLSSAVSRSLLVLTVLLYGISVVVTSSRFFIPDALKGPAVPDEGSPAQVSTRR
mmetsp:Transcript_4442/g.15883  ORF Transcript_4442/g.15883 Transcript_4442/m.15883 type:complete len:140 (-) Transcript_4442:160-579(-)